MSQRYYEEEEADAILRAAARKSTAGGMTHERLLATAAELGISPEAVEEAEMTVLRDKEEVNLRAEFDKHTKREFVSHLVSYLGTCAFMVAINLLTSPKEFWAVWVIVPWGIWVAVEFFNSLVKRSSDYEEEYEKWKLKREEKVMGLGKPDDLIREWLAIHPGDTSGAAKYVRDSLEIDYDSANRIVRRELSR